MNAIDILSAEIVVINGRNFRKKARSYVTTITTTATASAVASGNVGIDPSGPFICVSRHLKHSGDGTTLGVQLDLTVTQSDNENGYQYQNAPEDRASFAGDRILGYQLASPVIYKPNTQVTTAVTNPTGGGSAGTVLVTLRGFQLIPA